MSQDSQSAQLAPPQLEASVSGTPGRHSKFYALDDGVVFLIEDTLYRINRRLLNQSEFFKDMFDVASPHVGNEVEGLSDERPINPAGVTKFQIDSLLTLLQASLIDGDLNLTSEQWGAILHLSNKWVFRGAKEYAIGRIEGLQLDAITRILLARQNDVPKWLKDAYADLCQRPTLLTAEEVANIGVPTSIAIAGVREKMLLSGEACFSCRRRKCHQCSRRCGCGSSSQAYQGRCDSCQRYCGCGSNYPDSEIPKFVDIPRDRLDSFLAEMPALET